MSSKPFSILITGANRGLGLEMVRQIMDTQWPLRVLFACCRDLARAEALHALAKKHPDIIKVIQMDTTDLNSIKQAAGQVESLLGQSGLNLLINNAAICFNTTFLKSSAEDMLNCYKTNVVGPARIIHEFLPLFRAAVKDSGMPGMSCRKAAVVNISTIISSIENVKMFYDIMPMVPYRASKAGLNMMTACAALELQEDEILCALLHPGWVRTDMGGPDADIGVQESVEGMLRVINSMTEKNHGALVDYKGQPIAW